MGKQTTRFTGIIVAGLNRIELWAAERSSAFIVEARGRMDPVVEAPPGEASANVASPELKEGSTPTGRKVPRVCAARAPGEKLSKGVPIADLTASGAIQATGATVFLLCSHSNHLYSLITLLTFKSSAALSHIVRCLRGGTQTLKCRYTADLRSLRVGRSGDRKL